MMTRPLPAECYAALAALKAQAQAVTAALIPAAPRAGKGAGLSPLGQAQQAMAANEPWTSRIARALGANAHGITIDTADDAWLERVFAGYDEGAPLTQLAAEIPVSMADAPASKTSGDGALVARRLLSDLAHHAFMHCTAHDAVYGWGVQTGVLEELLHRDAPDFDRLDAMLSSLACKLSDDEGGMLLQLTDPQDTLPNLRDAVADLQYVVATWRAGGMVQIDRISLSGRRAALGEGSFRDQRFTSHF